MLVLALDTSSPAIAVALAEVDADGVTELAARREINAKGHGELLSPTVAAVLAEAGRHRTELGAVVAGVGPGPYTGLRVGLVTAAALGHALGVPTYGVCSLDGITGAEVVVTDARRKEVYWARYDAAGNRVDGPHVGPPQDVPNALTVTGAGVALFPDVFGEPAGELYPDPVRLVGRAADRIRAAAPSEPVIPLYLRHPDAVEPGAPKPVRQ